MGETVKLNVPLNLRKGTAKNNQKGSIQTAITGLEFILEKTKSKKLEELNILDYGCGVKYTQAFIENDIYPKTYTGVDVDQNMISFLQKNVNRESFTYRKLPFHNDMYNENGIKMQKDADLKIGNKKFDLIISLSVFTHLNKQDAQILLHIIKRYLAPKGKFFFTIFINDNMEKLYKDAVKDKPMAKTVFKSQFINKAIENAGLEIVDVLPKNDVFKTKTQYILKLK